MHVDTDLSAYLDRELPPAERARVEAHLAACQRCSARLADLSATASLVSALPGARPSRSLLPHVVERWNWLRPVRSLSTVASGAFLFLFLITAVAQTGSDLGGGPASPFTRFGPTSQGAPAGAQPAEAPAGAPAPDAIATGSPEAFKVAGPTAQPAPLGDTARAIASPVPTLPARSGAGAVGAPAAPQAASPGAERAEGASPTAAAASTEDSARETGIARSIGLEAGPPSPLVWLALALVMAIAAVVAHWRLRVT